MCALRQDNEEQLNEQLDMLPALCRFQLQPASSYIMTLFEPSANRYAQVLLTKLLFKTNPKLLFKTNPKLLVLTGD